MLVGDYVPGQRKINIFLFYVFLLLSPTFAVAKHSVRECANDLSLCTWKNRSIILWDRAIYKDGTCGSEVAHNWRYYYKDEICLRLQGTKIVFFGDSHTRHLFGAVQDFYMGYNDTANPLKDIAVPEKYREMCGTFSSRYVFLTTLN